MVTVRIEIVQNPKPLHIDHKLHPLMKSHFEQSTGPASWPSFCREMDGALNAPNTAVTIFRCLFFGGLSTCFTGFALFVLLTQDVSPIAFLPEDKFFLTVFFLFVVVIISNFFMVFCFRFQLKKSNLEMEEICREWTYKKKHLTFHVRYTPNPIAWYLFNRRGPLDKNGDLPAATSYIEVEIKSEYALVGDRLEELEGMKELLTDLEYHDLREGILSEV